MEGGPGVLSNSAVRSEGASPSPPGSPLEFLLSGRMHLDAPEEFETSELGKFNLNINQSIVSAVHQSNRGVMSPGRGVRRHSRKLTRF